MITDANPLGTYLRDRRARLDPAALGYPRERRRTPGLRREEVAQRANVSPTWYTWLEQGRGGAPSAELLDRISAGLLLTVSEREYLFMLGLGRLPDARYRAPEAVSPQLQRMLDALECSPAVIKTAWWDILAWNEAAAAVLTDYGALEPARRNVLRLLFGDAHKRARLVNWEDQARIVVASFRAEVTRADASKQVRALIDELSQSSADFARMWADHDVRILGEGTKQIHTPTHGLLTLEHAAFAVDGRPDLGLVVYTPATTADRDRVKALTAGRVNSR